LPFLLYRPWAILLLALLLGRVDWRGRVAGYALFLLLAGGSEAVAMLRLGNSYPWPEMLHGWAAGAVIALLVEVLLALTRRRGRWWTMATLLALAALAAVPPVRHLYLGLLETPQLAPAAQKPAVMLMSALPLVWGEGGAFDPSSRPAALYRALQGEFEIRPVDALDAESLSRARLLLLIQPRWLAPPELVALDSWVRSGGRALILTDPRLAWPSELAVGDIRRPPPSGLLKPLLDHWGLSLEPVAGGAKGALLDHGRWLEVESEGRLRPAGSACRSVREFLAECRIGEGRALILADADLVRDELWVAPGSDGAARHRRLSDNPLVVADLLDELAGVERARLMGDVRWRDPAVPLPPTLLGLLGLLAGLTLASGLAARLRRRR
jgi:hypothetical protein